ncbi:hypothetical protein [Companilactobacillus zhongbaensis]|uniref:hypothetical protein n=1 Tax=Companilactobacillus zhongbaensis TaxID=2486009 RepID=UPI0013DDDC34|nr:hypothetical protein [Companilactobacillus zhongbaensis]
METESSKTKNKSETKFFPTKQRSDDIAPQKSKRLVPKSRILGINKNKPIYLTKTVLHYRDKYRIPPKSDFCTILGPVGVEEIRRQPRNFRLHGMGRAYEKVKL